MSRPRLAKSSHEHLERVPRKLAHDRADAGPTSFTDVIVIGAFIRPAARRVMRGLEMDFWERRISGQSEFLVTGTPAQWRALRAWSRALNERWAARLSRVVGCVDKVLP